MGYNESPHTEVLNDLLSREFVVNSITTIMSSRGESVNKIKVLIVDDTIFNLFVLQELISEING